MHEHGKLQPYDGLPAGAGYLMSCGPGTIASAAPRGRSPHVERTWAQDRGRLVRKPEKPAAAPSPLLRRVKTGWTVA